MKITKTQLAQLALVVTVSAGTAVLVRPQLVTATLDVMGLNQQVQRQEEQLQNHEVRIENTEKDVEVIQNNTNTAPAPNPTPVPVVTTPAPEPTPEPAPVASAPEPAPKKPLDHQVARWEYVADPGVSYRTYWYCDRFYTDGTTETLNLGWVDGYKSDPSTPPTITYQCQAY